MALQLGKKTPFIKRKQVGHVRVARHRQNSLARSIAKSTLLLLILAIIGGVLYTWYIGQEVDSSAIAKPINLTPRAEFAKPRTDDNRRVGIATQSITSPVAPGANASITIRTNPSVPCTITVVYNKVASKDGGLMKKKADEFGVLSWAWTVDPATPVGKWPVTVLCANKKYSAKLIADLVVQVPKD